VTINNPGGGIKPPAGDITGTAAAPVVLTSNGAVFGTAAFQSAAVILASAVAATLSQVATTGAAGTALVNGTPTILSWTAPNDGSLHVVSVFSVIKVTTLEVGGLVQLLATTGGTAGTYTLMAAALGVGVTLGLATTAVVDPGTTVSIVQGSALTVGAATLFATMVAK
jgi:hypothetical protein